MGNEGSQRVVERVAEVIDRIGDAQDDAESKRPANATPDRSEAVTAVTDGGADEASPGNSPWAADDPIAFDESEEDPGAAILEAVTDDEVSAPFEEADDNTSGNDGDDSVSSERFDELEARVGALESDHVQLESQMADVASAVADLGSDVDRVGDDVLELVTLFGAVALATDRPTGSEFNPADVAAELASELEDRSVAAVAETSEAAGVERRNDASGSAGAFDPVDEAASAEVADATEGSDDVEGTEADDADSTAADHALSRDSVPEGIHRGVGDASAESPSPASSPNPEGASTEQQSAIPQSADAVSRDADAVPDDGSDHATDRNPGKPARELVDPRTDAVGARLRQFREGFVDDPTEDLPTGSSADEFRFEKVLLPSEGEHAPDLSTDELAKPYLESLPDGYAADAVVLEWLDWLVSAADGETAARAIGYYESIDWLTEDARAELLGYLDGLGDPGAFDGSTPVHEPPAALDLQDHLRSLQYVTELATGEVDADGI